VQIPGNTLGVRIQNDAAATARLLAVSAGSASWSNGNGVAQFTVGSTSATGRVLSIVNNGTGDSLHINHLGASGNGLIVTGGNVGIGTTTPGYKLEVAGSVRATSFISNSTTYADFVFKPGYKLASLTEVEAAIQRDGHLPGIPSEVEAREHGIDLAAMQVKLLQKVEELTLHLIAHEKQLDQLQQENAGLRRELAGLKDR
jgi:hypothetical protein